MCSTPLSEEQMKDAFDLYDVSWKCGMSAEESLKYALTSLNLDDRLYLKKLYETTVRKDHEGKDSAVEEFNFREAIQLIDEENRTNYHDLKDMFHILSEGKKFDISKLRKHAQSAQIRDLDIDDMF